jgi:transposase-like protein
MTNYPDELRDRAVREVIDSQGANESVAAACRRVGQALGINAATLRSWVRRTATSSITSPSSPPASLVGSPDISTPRRARWKTISGHVGGGLVGAAVAGISMATGAAHLPLIVFLILGAELAGVGFIVAHAVQATSVDAQMRSWRASFVVLMFLPIGAAIYHQWFDSARVPIRYEMVVNGNEGDSLPLIGEVGGSPQRIATGAAGQNGLIGGQTYEFDCWGRASDGNQWLRYQRFGQVWWAPRQYLHSPVVLPAPAIPQC